MFDRIRRRIKTVGSVLADILDTPGTPPNDSPGPPSSQQCSDRTYVRSLKNRLTESHVLPLTEFVDELRAAHPEQFIPYIAPTYGGTNARLLSLFQSPGANALRASSGSGMICIGNTGDNDSSYRHKKFLSAYGISVDQTVSWNAYPWTGSEKHRSLKESHEARDALISFLGLCPQLQVVMLHGRVAQDMWERVRDKDPALADSYFVIETYHTSKRLIDPRRVTADRIASYESNLRAAFAEAEEHLRYTDPDRTGVNLDWERRRDEFIPETDEPHIAEHPDLRPPF